jgi:deoxyribodipyrimidine photo-lyase
MVPSERISAVNRAPVRADGDYILYWMIATRRPHFNFGLQRAVEHAVRLAKPLVVLEPLRANHRWAAARFHQFAIDGMRDNAQGFRRPGVRYHPYLERSEGEGRGLLAALAARAAVVVTDDFPCFFLPQMVAAAGDALPVCLEAVDANGLLPLRATPKVHATAYSFRRALQATLPAHLGDRPLADPLAAMHGAPPELPPGVTARWPDALQWLDGGGSIGSLPIDHRVGPVNQRGGYRAAREVLQRFLVERLPEYGSARNHPDRDAASGLSPYLHWGHVSAHEVFDAVMTREGWLGDTPRRATGAREGWWGVGANAEAFLDQLVTWRELGFNFTSKRNDYDLFESLPPWAITTLDAHTADDREWVYDLDALESASTHDPLWNAAQRQLVSEGDMHNYMRMLWGKKILQWSATPREALAAMIELNNKYALDGRDPNSYSGIFWVLGRYDRPWFPERPIFGVVRYMTSESAARKLRLREYLKRYGRPDAEEPGANRNLFA